MRAQVLCLVAAAALPLACRRSSSPDPTAVYWNRAPLQPNAFAPLPLGAIKPEGWLKRQLRIQADGLSGHLDEFWPDLGPSSGWLGGTGESWERGPYYLDGLVPLAYLLEDSRLIGKVRKWMDWTLTHQRPSGAIGPDPARGTFAQEWQSADWWPNMVMLKALTQYQEASGDPRVIPLMTRYFHYHLAHANERPLLRWARMRWAEQLLSLAWLYNRTGDAKLLELARELHRQSFDWNAHFRDFRFPSKITDRKLAQLETHVVNNAMAIKTAAVWWQFSNDPADRDAHRRLLEVMDRHHLLPNGVHSGDEHYAGLDPSQGTELCAVVEAMFSFSQLAAILGDPAFSDRLERIAFNALPATFTADMWAHQYDQQPNQIKCSVNPNRNWTTNRGDANIFGLEPNFGCCTANMHQGWPKFVSHLWMASRDGGLAAIAYAPSTVTARVAGGVRVTIREETEYPFRGRILFRLNPERPASFPLRLRIPAWASQVSLTVAGESAPPPSPGAFHTLSRQWNPGDTVELNLALPLRAERHYRDSVTLLRGPLVLALPIGENWRKIKGELPHADWEVHPTTPWNYALDLDPANPAAAVTVEERPLGDFLFSPQGAAVVATAPGRRLPQWQMVNDSAGPLPPSPVRTRAPRETLTLIPYGSAKLRVTAFPVAAR